MSKAITTRYLPATNHKPSRIKASAEGVKSETWTCSELDDIREKDNLDNLNRHEVVARIFATLNNWPTTLASGGLPNGDWAHCFLPRAPEISDRCLLDCLLVEAEAVLEGAVSARVKLRDRVTETREILENRK